MTNRGEGRRGFTQETVPVDEWGNEFKYFMKQDLVKIQSAGPDKAFDTDDDIVNE